jgi:hypothetical protein
MSVGTPDGLDDATPQTALRFEARWLLPRSWILQTDFERLWDGGTRGAMLLVQPEAWLHRRVETWTIADAKRLRRRFSFDLCRPPNGCLGLLPTDRPEEASAESSPPADGLTPGPANVSRIEGLTFLPLMYLAKQPEAANIDLRDESGAALPLLSREENAIVTVAAVSDLITRLLSRAEAHECLADVVRLVTLEDEGSIAAADSLLDKGGLRHRTDMSRLLVSVVSASVLWLPLDLPTSGRRLIKIAYDQHIGRNFGSFVSRLPPSFGWREIKPTVGVHVGDARRYHLQIQPPGDLQIRDVRLLAARADQDHLDGVTRYRLLSSVSHVMTRSARPLYPVVAQIRIHPGRQGLITGAAVLLALIAAVLTGAFLSADALNRQNQVTTALLLLLPGLVVSVSARPNEHQLASALLAGTRSTLLAAGTLTALAAAAFAIFSPVNPTPKTVAASQLTTTLAVLMGASWLLLASGLGGVLRAVKPVNRLFLLGSIIIAFIGLAIVGPTLEDHRGVTLQRLAIVAAAATAFAFLTVALTAYVRQGANARDRERREAGRLPQLPSMSTIEGSWDDS